jgi:hypothetical protein
MKRTPLRPGQPPKRKTELKRSRKPIPKRRKDPSKRAWAKHRCKPYTDWLKTQACCLTGRVTGEWAWMGFGWDPWEYVHVDPAHVIKRSRGSDDLYNCIPLARHLHNEQEAKNAEFEAKYGRDLKALAREYTKRWLATPDGQAWLVEHPEAQR